MGEAQKPHWKNSQLFPSWLKWNLYNILLKPSTTDRDLGPSLLQLKSPKEAMHTRKSWKLWEEMCFPKSLGESIWGQEGIGSQSQPSKHTVPTLQSEVVTVAQAFHITYHDSTLQWKTKLALKLIQKSIPSPWDWYKMISICYWKLIKITEC